MSLSVFVYYTWELILSWNLTTVWLFNRLTDYVNHHAIRYKSSWGASKDPRVPKGLAVTLLYENTATNFAAATWRWKLAAAWPHWHPKTLLFTTWVSLGTRNGCCAPQRPSKMLVQEANSKSHFKNLGSVILHSAVLYSDFPLVRCM